jgi:nucleotide-binding universal stress UspA family protein
MKAILHPTRFSPEDCCVFRVACDIARATQRELVVVHVADRQKLHQCRESRIAIEDRLESLRLSQPDVHISTLVASGRPSSEIVSLSLEHSCSLIVMRPSRRRWWNRLVGQNISENVKRMARCPVLWLETNGSRNRRDVGATSGR